MNLAMYSVGFSLILLACAIASGSALPQVAISGADNINKLAVLRRAFAEIKPSEGEGLDTVWGHVFLAETAEGVFITGDVEGLKPGRHGFHVHQEGTLENDCKASGGHFNPEGVSVTTYTIFC